MGKKILVNIYFDVDDKYDSLILKTLKDLPDEARKNFLTSALLYYLKSPDYITQVKLDDQRSLLLKDLEAVNDGMNNVNRTKDDLIISIKDVLIEEIKKVLKDIKIVNQVVHSESVSGKKRSKEEEDIDINDKAKDIFNKLSNQFM